MKINPLPVMYLDDIYKFWRFIDKRTEDECWYTNQKAGRHPKVTINGETYLYSRVMYFIHYGVDPDELLVCHKCNNCNCVNPNHLYLGTCSDNAKDAHKDGLIRIFRERFSKEDILEIRRLHAFGIPINEIAKQYCISASYVYKLISSERRNDV